VIDVNLLSYQREMEIELQDILSYWSDNTIDHVHGGFYGSVDNENNAHHESPKGVVLNSRILWTFSAAYLATNKKEYLNAARRSYQYLNDHFIDEEFGGVYWSLDHKGKMLNGRKQIYGLAFCLYGLSEFYKAEKNDTVLEQAINLFKVIEKYSYDEKLKGYYEAFARDWQSLDDSRLSEKDANEKKTMNTHLHVIEAYANLYEIWPDEYLKKQIENLLEVFDQYIIDDSGHLSLFFDEAWKHKSDIISYGHDIEAAWLLQQCAEKIDNEFWVTQMKSNAKKITNAATEGLDKDGGLWYEYELATNKLIKEKHWWPQSEAMIGFMNAYQISEKKEYLLYSYHSWQFVKQHIKDNKKGEWFWGVNDDYSIMQGHDKAGFWKCPYHNSRACLEIIRRISMLT